MSDHYPSEFPQAQQPSILSGGVEQALRALVEHASDAVIIQDQQTGRIVEANRRAEELYGYTRGEFLAFPSGWDLRAGDEEDDVSLFVLGNQGQDVPQRPRWHRRKDGAVIPVEAGVTRIVLDDRTLLVATLRDVSARLAAQAETERLYAESVRHAREVEALLEATAALNDAESEEEVIHTVAERAARLCDSAIASVAVVYDGAIAWIEVWQGGTWARIPYEPPAVGNIITRVVASAHPYRCNDLTSDPFSDHEFDGAMGLRTQLTVPAAGSNGAVLCAISLYNKTAGPFTAHDQALLVALARQAAVALERARSRDDLARALEAVRSREDRFRSLVQNGSDLIILLDAKGVVQYVSPSIERLLGYQAEEFVGTNGFSYVHPDDLPVVLGHFQRRLTQPDSPRQTADYRLRHKNGTWRSMDMLSTNLLHHPSVGGIVINLRDVTERRALEDELARRAFYDTLTGLPNRALFMERLESALAVGDERDDLAVIFLDLDGFKVINDSMGHGAGDALLVEAGSRIAACTGTEDTLARFGGDEFTILVAGGGTAPVARGIAECVIAALREPFTVRGRQVFVTASAGIALAPASEPCTTPDELLREADIALYQAKAAGKSRAVVFDDAMNARALARMELEHDLRCAIESGQLRLAFQPEVELGNGTIVGLEALVRWQHPERGLISPAEFIPLAEETGLILPLGRWVLEEACRQARAWQLEYPLLANLIVSVNLSVRQFQQPGLVEQVKEALRASGLPPACLCLEITESLLMDDVPEVEETLNRLRDLGVWLAIDDFGTGYSSLSYLRRLAVDTVKIDRSFVTPLDHDQSAAAIVRAVVAMSHALGMDVIAEGIETDAQMMRLRAAGCDRAQGYLFARPLSPADLAPLLASGSIVLPGDAARVA